jgi:uncharacterized iron-regulated protein
MPPETNMGRLLLATAAILTVFAITVHAEKPEAIDTVGLAGADVRFHRVDYMRELWVGLPGAGVDADAMLKDLRAACDDTTAVAVISTGISEEISADESELSVLRAVAARAALLRLKSKLDLNPRWTRVVLVGVLDACVDAVRMADNTQAGVDGLVLIDPPVEDIPAAEERAARVGVDVLLHSRSEAEFERDTGRVVERLGDWGRSARVLRGEDAFSGLDQRVRDAWNRLRAPLWNKTPSLGWVSPTALAGEIVGDRDVIMVGELHGNPGAHRAQLEFLRYMHATGRPMALSTEQFERDVQGHLDAYLAGGIDEDDFLSKSRPWPNYADYRPLIEFCKANGIPVIAGNIPRRLAARIHKEGVETFEDFSEQEKSWSARELNALPGAYKDKFMGLMGGHSDKLESMYAAQCIKDDTMAESIADWLKANPGGRVLHINGAFHSAGGLGVPEKLEVLMDDVRIGLVTCVQDEGAEAAPEEWILRVPSSRPMRQAPSMREHR